MSKKATIIAVVNQKGGTGKTTTTENLGVGLALEGKKVLLVDTDPQASLTVSLGNPCPDDLSPTLSDLMGKIMMESPIALGEGILHHPEGVDLVPSNIELSGIHSEKDILKLVTTLIANTKGDGKAGDEFWTKAETLLYCALIGYIHYEAPVEEQNFSTLIEFLNAMEVREDDEEFQNPVDLMFEALEKKKPNHFAVRQYKKYKLAAGDVWKN